MIKSFLWRWRGWLFTPEIATELGGSLWAELVSAADLATTTTTY